MANNIIATKKQRKKLQNSQLPYKLRYFDDLIQDNIDHVDITNKINKDATQYASANVLYDNPLMFIIIQKK